MATTTQSSSSAGWVAENWAWFRELPKALPTHQLILISTAVIAIVIDQATKWWVEANMVLHTRWAPLPAIAHFFDFLHVKNPGAAFGTGQQLGWLFSIIAFVVCGFILFYNSVILGRHPAFRIALGLIMGGALGNVIDRFRIGEVTDFINFDFRPFVSEAIAEMIPLVNFAIFNLADTFIFSGVIIMFTLMWKDTLPDDPWTEEEEQGPREAFHEWEQKVAMNTGAANDTVEANRTTQRVANNRVTYGQPDSAEEESQRSNGRLGLKIAIGLGIIGLIIALIVYLRRQKADR